MSLVSYLHTVQQKPEPARRRILYMSIGIIMAAIVSLWVINVRLTLLHLEQPATEVSQSPFTQLKLFFLESLEAVRATSKTTPSH